MAAQPALEAVEAIASVWEYHDPRNPPATLVLFKDTLGNRQVLFKSHHTGMLSDVHGAWFIVRDTTTQQVFLKLEFNCRGSKAKSLVNLAFQQVTHLIFEAKRSGVCITLKWLRGMNVYSSAAPMPMLTLPKDISTWLHLTSGTNFFVGEKKIQIESVFYIFYGTQHRVNTIKQHFQSCVWNKYGTHIQLGSFTLKLKLTYNDGERLTVLLDHMTMLDDVKEFLARSVVEAVQQEPEWHTVDTLTVVERLEDATLC